VLVLGDSLLSFIGVHQETTLTVYALIM